MPGAVPPRIVVEAFLASSTTHTRRVEIYEQDGITRWEKDTIPRLKSGNVTVDYSRSERRAIDLVLSNTDGVIETRAGEFWYDKVIKVFRGVVVNEVRPQAKVVILCDKDDVSSRGGILSNSFRSVLSSFDMSEVSIRTLATKYAEVSEFDIYVSLGSPSSDQLTIMHGAYTAGKSVIIEGEGGGDYMTAKLTGVTSYSHISGSDITPRPGSINPVAKGWTHFAPASGAIFEYKTTEPNWEPVSSADAEPTAALVHIIHNKVNNGRIVLFTFPINHELHEDARFDNLTKSAMKWLDKYIPITTWEAQVGEFMIDRISESNFPKEVRVTGRDYTKKGLLSKYAYATQFSTGLSLESILGTIAGSAGITKRSLPATGITVNKTFFFERGVEHWTAMKDIANSYNYDIYFDAYGYLIIKEFQDPADSSPSMFIKTGPGGQVATWEKSTSDSRLYNHVIVTGESSDASVLPVYGEAINNTAGSPTSVAEISDRLYQYVSSFIRTTLQAQDVADKFLAIHSLEEFELTLTTLMLPWLDVGEILDFDDRENQIGDPNRFLLSSITIPLELAPMGASGKRVTIVS